MSFGTPFGFTPEETVVAEKPTVKEQKVKSEPKTPAPRKKAAKGDAK
jgi:hypothetical protein